MLALFENRKGRFSHGIHPRYHKDATRGKPSSGWRFRRA